MRYRRIDLTAAIWVAWLQTMFAAAATWTFGRGVFEVSSAIVVCLGDCVMADDFTKSADSLLTGFLVS